MSKRITVAIDGPAGAGKSTLARRIADKLGYFYIDTGAMYRAVALWALRTQVALSDMHRLEQLANEAVIEFVPGTNAVLLNGEDVTESIRAPEIADASSEVARVPAVRRALVLKQREIGANASVVMEGRDIGSVVFPDATVKIFLDAHPRSARGAPRRRDMRYRPKWWRVKSMSAISGTARAPESPLLQAPDAIYVDTTGLSIEDVEAALLKIIRDRTSNGKERTQ